MRIAILTGGTGSIALQRGLYDSLEARMDGIDVKIIVNAYDNGLSTGAVRSVMNGQILGPSDVRKNQTTRLRLRSSSDPWLHLLEHRFTSEPSRAQQFCNERVSGFLALNGDRCGSVDLRDLLIGAIEEYFKQAKANESEYHDFSLANIIYAGLASANGNSLRAAGRIMADAMNIPDNVLLNDDRSLFLGAVTASGRRVTDEGEIVSWGNKADPFVDIFFIDPDGKEAVPELSVEAWHAIVDADLIILSSGTQWSSLIPTYASHGFTAAVRESNARIALVVNRTPDKDSPGLTASEIVDLLVPRYFECGRLHVLADRNGHPSMQDLSQSAGLKVASFAQMDLSTPMDAPDKHNPAKLAYAIGYVFFEEYLDSSMFLFDYDDTLVGRKNKYPKSSGFNVSGLCLLNSLLPVGICTGNTIRALNLRGYAATPRERHEGFQKPLLVFADGGVNEYAYDLQPIAGSSAPEVVKCLAPETVLSAGGLYSARDIVDALVRAGIPASKIENRGNAVIAIKPVPPEQRRAVMSLARNIVYGSDLIVRTCGTTTIEIHKPTLSKVWALKHLCDRPNPPTITYVGDECESGNDHDVHRFATEVTRIKCLHVDSPAKTAFFISTLIAHFGNGNC